MLVNETFHFVPLQHEAGAEAKRLLHSTHQEERETVLSLHSVGIGVVNVQERAIAEESKKGTAAVHLGAKARQPITSSSSRGRAHAFALPKSAGNAKPNQKKRKSGRHMSVGQLYLDAYVCM